MPSCFVFGDSNTYGTVPMAQLGADQRYPREDRWPDVMATCLGGGWDVVSEGLPGRTTVHDDPVGGGSRSGLEMLRSSLPAHGPVDVLVIMLGTNDLKGRFALSAREIARSLGHLVSLAQASGKARHVLLVTPPAVREIGCLANDFCGAEARARGLPTAVADIAAELGCHAYDAGCVIAVSETDGVHFEAAGHHALGRAVAAEILKIGDFS